MEKLAALEELHKKCEIQKTSLRDEIMTRSSDEGYKTMELVVSKEKEELEYQLQEVRNDRHDYNNCLQLVHVLECELS